MGDLLFVHSEDLVFDAWKIRDGPQSELREVSSINGEMRGDRFMWLREEKGMEVELVSRGYGCKNNVKMSALGTAIMLPSRNVSPVSWIWRRGAGS